MLTGGIRTPSTTRNACYYRECRLQRFGLLHQGGELQGGSDIVDHILEKEELILYFRPRTQLFLLRACNTNSL